MSRPPPPEPARPTLRERQRELTREALVRGARAAFQERGYAAVTVDDITGRAGTSRGTFYLHFTKATVLRELLHAAFGLSETTDDGAVPITLARADLSDVPAIRSWLRRYVRVWETHRPLARAWMEGDAVDPQLRAMTDRRIGRVVAALTERIRDAHRARHQEIDPAQARARATLMDLELQYFCYHVVGRGLDTPLEAGVDAMAEHWARSLHGEALRAPPNH